MKKRVTFLLLIFGLLPTVMVLGQSDEPKILKEVLLNGQAIDLEKGFRLHDEGLKEAQKFTLIFNEPTSEVESISCTGVHGRRSVFSTEINLSTNTSATISQDGKEISFSLPAIRSELAIKRWEDNSKGARLVIYLYNTDSENGAFLCSITVIVD